MIFQLNGKLQCYFSCSTEQSLKTCLSTSLYDGNPEIGTWT